jgi:DNA ligase-1
MEELLKELTELVYRLREYPSILDKKAILKKYPHLKGVLKWVYDPGKKFYITGKQLQDNFYMFESNETNLNIYQLFDLISKREVTGNLAISYCLSFIKKYIQYKDILFLIFNKDLRCGISVKTINSVFSKLIPEFNIPLANDYNPKKHNIFNKEYLVSRKLNGLRCLCFLEPNKITFLSKKGKEFWTFGIIEKELKEKFDIPKEGLVLDGEMCIFKNGIEYFQLIIREFRKKNHTISHPLYYVFDMYTMNDFKKGKDSFLNYKTKYRIIQNLFKNYIYIKPLEQRELISGKQLEFPIEWEGLVLRKNESSLFKRTDNLLKVKNFEEEEFKVLDIETSTIMVEGERINSCGSLIIKYKGIYVGVGSGLTQDQRINWFQNPEDIIGKIITVRYTTTSENKKGESSLIFPRLKGIRDGY